MSRFLDTETVARLPVTAAADALDAALRGGLDPEADPPRSAVPVGAGQLLLMPSEAGGRVAVKLVSIAPGNPARGLPRIDGVVAVFDGATLALAALVEGRALTLLRTAAVSALGLRHLAPPDARRLLVFGRGPQATAHIEAVRAIRPTIDHVDLVGRGDDASGLVQRADVICCCTTAREPLFDGGLVADHAAVAAIGAHEPDARELDGSLMQRAGAVVVESRASAMREAGDVILAGLPPERLTTLAELLGGAEIPPGPRVLKTTGMSWEDAIVAGAVLDAIRA